jgi:LPPG:FO 2-phospho-L-lactate transferase
MIVALAGGVGGAKLADGLAAVIGDDLAVVVNTGDDFEHFGLAVSPDLDTVMYTVAGIANPETGWGISGESWNFLDQAARLGAPAWFRIGDRDLATHVLRSERLRRGERLTSITADLCQRLGIKVQILPMSDAPVRTKRPKDRWPFRNILSRAAARSWSPDSYSPASSVRGRPRKCGRPCSIPRSPPS